VVRDTETEAGALEEVTAGNDFIMTSLKSLKLRVTTSFQTYQTGVTKTSETGSEPINFPLFSLRMNYRG